MMTWRTLLAPMSLLALWPATIGAQTWTARVVDAQTKEAIAYASIGILGATRGTLTDEDGRFDLSLATTAGDSVRVSAIGYRPCTYALLTPPPTVVTLHPEPVMTQVVEVRSTALGRLRTAGVTKRPANVTFFFQSNQLGTELGTVIDLPDSKELYVKAMNFYLIQNQYGPVKFRVHLYRFTGDTERLVDLLPQSAFLTTEATSGWVRLDLTDLDVVIKNEEKVLLSLEWLENRNPGRSAKDLQFGTVLSPAGSIHYKRAVESEWEYLSQRYYGLRTKLGFHLEYYELKK